MCYWYTVLTCYTFFLTWQLSCFNSQDSKRKHTALCNKDTDAMLGSPVAKTIAARVINCLSLGKSRHLKIYFHPKWVKNIKTPKCLVNVDSAVFWFGNINQALLKHFYSNIEILYSGHLKVWTWKKIQMKNGNIEMEYSILFKNVLNVFCIKFLHITR